MLSKKEAKAVRGLIQGETKQTANNLITSGDTKTNVCAVRSDATSDTGVGMLATTQDSCEIKYVELRGSFELAPLVRTAAQMPAVTSHRVRRLLLWWYHNIDNLPTVPAAIGALTVDGFLPDDTSNAGQWKVLHDKVFNIGTNVFCVDPAVGTTVNSIAQNGKVRIDFAEKVIVNKVQKYNDIPTPTSLAGQAGSSLPGSVSRGLLVMYHIYEGNGGTLTNVCRYRVTYVG